MREFRSSLSHPDSGDNNQSLTYCLSNDGCVASRLPLVKRARIVTSRACRTSSPNVSTPSASRAQLDLGVGQDDAPLAGDLGAARVDGERDPAQRLGGLRAHVADDPLEGDRLVVLARPGPCVEGVKIGSGSRPPSSRPGGSCDPGDRARRAGSR